MAYIHRMLEKLLKEDVSTSPLVYLNGMRQCGKSTLAQNIFIHKEMNYITFDNPAILFFAKNDPSGFIQQLPNNKLNIIDEVQLAPELFRYFKMAIDEKRLHNKTKAPYLLTGSANIFAMPKLTDALVGRMSTLTLYPFSISEINNTGINFIEKLWRIDLHSKRYNKANIVDIISDATFPEIAMDKKKNRYLWFNNYIATILQRDVKTLADIKNPDNIYQLLVSLSQRAGSLLNNANVMKEIGLDAKTYEKYKALCSSAFLIFELPPWSKPNKLNKRFVKQKKLFFTDTNLLCHIMQRDMKEMYKNDKTTMGHLFENFIATEIMKAAKSLGSLNVSHFNPVQNQGKEVDFVIEKPNGDAIAIEVKLDGTINERDWANMTVLSNTLGERFIKGIIIYTGTELMQVGRNIWAIPVNFLWERD
ncbi:MAG: ATP-binding protein [Spirochaetes bacterium]|nr:ATP-binding protein [Spirochaetota bacterium]